MSQPSVTRSAISRRMPYSSSFACRSPDPRALDVPRSRESDRHLLVPVGRPRADGRHRPALRTVRRVRRGGGLVMPPAVPFPTLVQDFFQRRLVAERRVSAHTVASYRDTFTLFLRHVEQRTGKTPAALTLEDLTPPAILAFLDRLETECGNSPRTRNLRLTALRSFMRTPPYAIPPHCRCRSACSPSCPSGSTIRSWASCPGKRSKPCLTLRTAPHEAGTAMRSSSLCCTTRAHGCPRSPACVWPTSSWIAQPPCTCMAKAARNESSLSGNAPRRSCMIGWAESAGRHMLRCFQIVAGVRSRAPAESTACRWFSRQRRYAVHPSPRVRFRLTAATLHGDALLQSGAGHLSHCPMVGSRGSGYDPLLHRS